VIRTKVLALAIIAAVAFAAPYSFAADPPATTQPASAKTTTTDAKSDDKKSDDQLPAPLESYMGRIVAPYMTFHGAPWLMRPERQEEEHCKQLLSALKIKPGQVVCDMGCGSGFYTVRMAKLVGEKGTVLAVDIQPEMLSLLDKTAKRAGTKHIKPVLGTPIDPNLPDGEVDLILLVDVYHEFGYPEQMLAAMRKSLKPGGRIALAEFRLEDPNVPIKLLHKMSKEQILKEFSANGLKVVEQFDDLPWQHLMFFERDEAKK
jgi:ubiquinone/menaquinone biosynthesis C-methylase UbiE